MLIARTAGAAEVALAVDHRQRRTVVVLGRGDATDGASDLATWLDARAPRPARNRTGPSASFVVVAPSVARAAPAQSPAPHRRLIVPAGRTRVAIGCAFRSAGGAATLERRFPASLARPAAALASTLLRQRDEAAELADLRHADAERQRFVSVVAHELRTPLASLGGYLDLVAAARGRDRPSAATAARTPDEATGTPLDGPGAPPDEASGMPLDGVAQETAVAGVAEFLDRARDLVAGMSTLVADLLELSRLDAGQLRLVPAPFSGSEVAQAALRDLTPLALERGIDLETNLPSRLRMIHADRQRVQQILVNLLGNAIKFSPPASRVTLALRFDGPVAVYSVRDHGPGIAPEERALIFEPFHRASGAERVVGTGLGLPIARDLARRMGGEVDVASMPGRGSVFIVALPGLDSTDPATVAAALRDELRRAEAVLASTG
jgi:signal transduction histidine kinase